MSSYEAHITFPGHMSDGVKSEVDEWDVSVWKFSRMVGDPVMGDGEYCYLTAHDTDLERLKREMSMTIELMTFLHMKPVRAKVELDVYDERF